MKDSPDNDKKIGAFHMNLNVSGKGVDVARVKVLFSAFIDRLKTLGADVGKLNEGEDPNVGVTGGGSFSSDHADVPALTVPDLHAEPPQAA
jgi:hypothetical protein